jgi:adenylate cyclase
MALKTAKDSYPNLCFCDNCNLHSFHHNRKRCGGHRTSPPIWDMRTAREAMALSNSGIVYALGVSALITFVFGIRDLIGPSLFTSLLLGRYHRPTKEERIFLFLDITDSTEFADLNGDLETQAYLNQIFCALALPVRRSRGSIDDYVGDMAIVTWPKRRGIRDAACLRCVFDFAAELEKKSVEWNVHFGQLPQFRAVLHCGWVVTAEIGMERHKIAYFGDVMNTTGRLEALAKNFDEQVLVSAELFNSLVNPPGHLTSKNLGRHELRGRSEPLEVFAIRHIASRESEAVDSKNLQRQ